MENWPEVEAGDSSVAYDIEETCVVESVELEGAQWVTRLVCGEDEPARVAIVSIASTPGGTPAWSAKEMLTLFGDAQVEDFAGFEHLELRRGELPLMQGLRGGTDLSVESLLSRIGASADHLVCGAPELSDPDALETGRLALEFEEGGETQAIVSGHRGRFEVEDDTVLDIDVEVAESGHCCYSPIELAVLKRRLIPSR